MRIYETLMELFIKQPQFKTIKDINIQLNNLNLLNKENAKQRIVDMGFENIEQYKDQLNNLKIAYQLQDKIIKDSQGNLWKIDNVDNDLISGSVQLIGKQGQGQIHISLSDIKYYKQV